MKGENMYVEGRPMGAAISVAEKASIQTALDIQENVLEALEKLITELRTVLSPVIVQEPKVETETLRPLPGDSSELRIAIVTRTERLTRIVTSASDLIAGLDLAK